MNSQTTNGLYGLANAVLSKEGIVGLVLMVLLGFFIYVYWSSLQAMHAAHIKQTEILEEIKEAEVEQTDVLRDIRFSLRENGGLVFRNDAR